MKLVFHRDGREGLPHPVERAPVRGRPPPIEQAGLPEQHCAGADRCECLDLLRALRDPRQHALVADLLARSPSPRHDEDVERRTGLERRVGNNAQAPGCHHGLHTLGDQQDLEGRGLLSAPILVEACYGEHLVGPEAIQHLDGGEDQNSDALVSHFFSSQLRRFGSDDGTRPDSPEPCEGTSAA